MRVGALDDLAVHFEYEAHHPVRGGVLRPEIHREVLDARPAGQFAGGSVRGGHRARRVAHGVAPVGPAPAPRLSPLAFSSPGSTLSIPSQGDRKSKLRNSCFSRTG